MRIAMLTAALLGLALSSAASAGEPKDPIKEYARRLEEIRSSLRSACESAGLEFHRFGYSARDVSMMRDQFRLNQFDAWISDPVYFKVSCDSLGARLRNSAHDPALALDTLCRVNDVAFF